jgi:hypothetical protein
MEITQVPMHGKLDTATLAAKSHGLVTVQSTESHGGASPYGHVTATHPERFLTCTFADATGQVDGPALLQTHFCPTALLPVLTRHLVLRMEFAK